MQFYFLLKFPLFSSWSREYRMISRIWSTTTIDNTHADNEKSKQWARIAHLLHISQRQTQTQWSSTGSCEIEAIDAWSEWVSWIFLLELNCRVSIGDDQNIQNLFLNNNLLNLWIRELVFIDWFWFETETTICLAFLASPDHFYNFFFIILCVSFTSGIGS